MKPMSVDCTDEQKNIFMHYAVSRVLRAQSATTASDAISYTMTLSTIDKRAQSSALASRAAEAMGEFRRCILAYRALTWASLAVNLE